MSPVIDALTRQGRRATTAYAYSFMGKRSVYGPAGPIEHHDDWAVRVSVPRTRFYGTAEGRPSHPLKKVHIVREQIVASHRIADEVRWTHWLCGGATFEAVLTSEVPARVCAACLLVHQGRKTDPLPSPVRR